MSDNIATPRSAQFFYDHAGYSYDPSTETEEEGRRRGAERLERAHAQLADAVDARIARVTWEVDEDLTFWEDVDADNVEVMWCGLRIACGCCGQFAPIAAMGGIQLDRWASGRDPYCDVIEAELALEANDELTAALAAHMEAAGTDDE